tara:strand:- start:24107 stop:24373 length:267 start_codon:yes stop_codon:yes gene_type:complete
MSKSRPGKAAILFAAMATFLAPVMPVASHGAVITYEALNFSQNTSPLFTPDGKYKARGGQEGKYNHKKLKGYQRENLRKGLKKYGRKR